MKIKIKQTVIEDIIDFAKNNYPNEFVAFIEGKILENKIIIEGLLYQHFKSNRNSAFVLMHNLPLLSNILGTVHSHPRPNAKPSLADSRLFNRQGGIHIIIGYPYTKKDIHLYDLDLNEHEFEVIH